MLDNLILISHLVVAIAIIGLILLQQGKGAEMGASFGAGASQTLFGSSGSGNFFAKVTAVLAAVFFVTSLSLAVLAKRSSVVEDDLGLPALEEVDVPVIDDQSDAEIPSLIEDDSVIESAEAKVEELVDEVKESSGNAVDELKQELPEIPKD